MSYRLTYIEIDVPSFSHTSLLHFDGDNGSTNIVDSDGGRQWTAVGNAHIDTSQSKFGGASGVFAGGSDSITGDGSDDFAFGTGDFTIDLWFFPTDLTTDAQALYEGRPAATNGFYPSIQLADGNKVKFRVNGADVIIGTTILTSTWHHVGVTRSGASTRLFLNGIQEGSTWTDTSNYINAGASTPRIGANNVVAGPFIGWIDELRVIKGIAAWTSNFTPPTSAYSAATFRFAVDADYLPRDIAAIPSIKSVSLAPAEIDLGASLGQRATITVMFRDHRYSFAGEAFNSGTFWGKFRARYGLRLRGHPLRWVQGELGQALADMETRHYLIETVDGPTAGGEYKIIAKDLLKFADGDRAQAPRLSTGLLVADIASGATSATLSPTGVGDSDPYPAEGYANIAGKEIVHFFRAPQVKLLLHFEGADASTTITDSSPNVRTVTRLGGEIDTAQFRFGSSSFFTNNSNLNALNVADSADFAYGSGDFSVECSVRFTTVPSGAPNGTFDRLMIYSVDGSNNQFIFGFDGTDVLFLAKNANVTVAQYSVAHGMSNDTWYDWALVRSGTSIFIFKNGVSLSLTVTTAIGSTSLNDIASSVSICGLFTSIAGPTWMDELRICKGLATRTANYTPAALVNIGSGDILTPLARAQFNTTAQDLKAGDRVQVCVEYTGIDPALIIQDLLVSYSGVDSTYIPITDWQTETATFLGNVYTALIAEPTSVNKLLSELIEQAALAVWWDDVRQHINLQVLREISTLAYTFDEDSIMAGSLDIQEQPDKRISQVYTYFGKINPLVNEDQIDNYRSTVLTSDPTSDLDYGSTSIKKIFSRWIPAGGHSIAQTLNDKILGRFVDPPRKFKFEVFRQSLVTPELGVGYQLRSWPLQDVTGAQVSVPIQVFRLDPRAEKFIVEAEEMLWTEYGAPAGARTIIFDANQNNINLRTIHDAIYPEPLGGSPGEVIYAYINAGVIIGSTSTSLRAFDVGSWPAGVTINLIVNGRIQGAGGKGGNGGASSFITSSPGQSGGSGGTALYTRFAINLTSTNGQIWGGGGGGGGGGGFTDGSTFAWGGSGGGGGAGFSVAGAAGSGAFGTTISGSSGQAGTSEAGGSPGTLTLDGGHGGSPGTVGNNGQNGTASGGSGGSAGRAIDGDSFVTDVGALGSILGPQIN